MKSRGNLPALSVLAAILVITMLVFTWGHSGNTKEAEAQTAGVDFSIAIVGCDSSGGKCDITPSTDFTVEVSLDDISGLPNGAYDHMGVTVAYTGVSSNGPLTMVWPDCVFGAPAWGNGWETYDCAIGIVAPSSTYTGIVETGSFRCDADGSVSLVHGATDTFVVDDKGTTHVETGADYIAVNCVGPTFTPEPTVTPTPTATAAPTSTPCPPSVCPDLNFLIAVGGCDSSLGYNKCYVPADTDFTVDVILQGISALPNKAYDSLMYTVHYEGVSSNGAPTLVWPDCVFGAPFSGPDYESWGCAIGIGAPSSTYTGVIGTVSFGCDADGSVSLLNDTSNTFLMDDKDNPAVSEAGPDVLTIKCEDGTPRPTATPMPPKDPDADTDGDTVPNSADLDDDNDGCPDEAENGFDETRGGRRDSHNPWDYFNPTNDGQNRVDDILALVNHYFLADGDPGYDAKYDRTAIPETAKEPWRLGSPSGQILVDDILHVIDSYRHDCGTGIE